MTLSIAIVGVGPTGLYAFQKLVNTSEPLAIWLVEKGDRAGIGMPYTPDKNDRLMLANIASIEIPPLCISYYEWLKKQPDAILRSYGIKPESLDERTFTPRLLLGEYYRAQFVALVGQGEERGHHIEILEGVEIEDVVPHKNAVELVSTVGVIEQLFDRVILATGHLFPVDEVETDHYYPSPWSGLIDAQIPATSVGIMGTSLSAIDAAMAVACQHGRFQESENRELSYVLRTEESKLAISLLSRSGILPEADFYCPLPYEPLFVCDEAALKREVGMGVRGLLDRAYALFAKEIETNDPDWAEEIAIRDLDVETFFEAYFARRMKSDPFKWARRNLGEAEENRGAKITIAWRYAILRMHEAFEMLYTDLSVDDRQRFDRTLKRVFVDNYAAIPPESIRRMLALRDAQILSVVGLGEDYDMKVTSERTIITGQDQTHEFEVFIDARGQQALGSKDLPFPTLREMLLHAGSEVPEIGDDYSIVVPPELEGLVSLGALPFLMHDRPFIQGITACAEVGGAMGHVIRRQAQRRRRWLLEA